MKISKELKAGVITLVAIGLLVSGVNFLKGNSFFGGDDQYTAYFPNSGNLTPATSVYVNGVAVGKVLSVEYVITKDSLAKVKVTFNIQHEDVRIPRGSDVLIGSIDPLTKGVILQLNSDVSKGYYALGEPIQGHVDKDIISQFKSYADPVVQKFQTLMTTVDKTVSSFNDVAGDELGQSMNDIQVAIRKFSNVADELDGLVASERVRLSRIFSNVESITANLKASNDQIAGILSNAKTLTDDLVSANVKEVIASAKSALAQFALALDNANQGKGTLGKLLKDESLYKELNETNQSLQNLLDDLKANPGRYVHISVFGGKTKGTVLTDTEEKKLKTLLDSLPDNN